MRRLALPLLIFFMAAALPSISRAEDVIFFRMAHNDGTVSFFNFNTPFVPPMVQEIALMTLRKPFYPNLIESEYYQLSITHGVLWEGEKVVQYDYTPLLPDRFRHVLWVTEDLSSVVKLEIYDNNNKLLYCAICLSQHIPANAPPPIKKPSEQRAHYFGFVNQHTETQPDGGMRMLFTDGLNRFSVFRTPIPGKPQRTGTEKVSESDNKSGSQAERLIVYGNYVYNENRDGFKYTVVGTIPFDKMEEMIDMLPASALKNKKTIKNKDLAADSIADNISNSSSDNVSDNVSGNISK